MNTQNLQTYFLFALLVGVLTVSFFIFRPFIYAIALAAASAVVFQPVYRRLLKLMPNKAWLASIIATLAIIAFIVAPLILLGIRISQEVQHLYLSLAETGGKSGIISAVDKLVGGAKHYLPLPSDFSFDIEQYFKPGLDWLFGHLGDVFSNLAKMALSFFVFIVAVYYFFKDGHKLKKAVVSLSPLADDEDETIFRKLKLAVNSAVMGNLIIALIKGLLTAAGFLLFGISNPALWGTVAAVAALVPGIGTALVFIPAVFFLFVGGKAVFAAGLLIWGMVVVGLIDNFLGPKLIGRGMKLHPLVVLLSVLGGFAFFGPIGFLLGPLVVSLLFALLDVYSSLIKTR